MKIAICDDDLGDIEIIRNHILTHRRQHEILEFTSAEPLLKRIYGGERFDLLFLDVQMPDSDGWKIAKEIKKAKLRVFIAMVTVMGEYISECFDRVDWFAEKPITREKAHSIIDIAFEKLYPSAFGFQTEKGNVSLTVPEIIYVEADHNHINIHATNGVARTRSTLMELNEKLSDMSCFARIHKGFILNLQYLDKVDGDYAKIKTGQRVPVSRNGRKALFEALDKYIGGDVFD
jgi:DNA-binding LytR/AlgR family response regulator